MFAAVPCQLILRGPAVGSQCVLADVAAECDVLDVHVLACLGREVRISVDVLINESQLLYSPVTSTHNSSSILEMYSQSSRPVL